MMQNEIYILKKNAWLQSKIYYSIIGKRLSQIFNFLTVSSLLIAGTGFFQTLGGYILLDARPNIRICLTVSLMTFGVYSINKLTDIKEDAINRPERISFLKGRETQTLVLSIFALLLSTILAYSNEHRALPILFIPFIANCAYSSQIHPALPRLKDIPFVKNIVVGLSWALVCTLMPAVTIDDCLSLPVASVVYLMLIKDFINSTLCDLKDVNGDRENGVQTIPVILGSAKTKRILMTLNSSLLPLLFLVKGKTLIIISLLILTEYIFIICFSESSCPTVLEFFVDGEWLLTCLLLYGTGVIGG
jgi:4-hydroxybenzoate polyprenyltransferase